MDGRRRQVLRAAASLATATWLGTAIAQDARTSLAQAAARDWLVIADRGDGGATWDAAGKQFRDAITRARWAESLTAVRSPIGAMTQRSVLSTTFQKTVPRGPEGDYAVVLFRTSFAKKIDARETVTVEREPGGQWRVVGYAIQ